MKKHFRLLMAALLMGSVAFFSACSDDDDDNATPVTAPTVTFKSGDGYTSEDATVDQGTMIKVGITAEQSGAELSKLTIIKTPAGGAAETVVDSTISGTTFTMDYEFAMGAADESWTFTVSNSKGMTADKVLKLTVEQAVMNTFAGIKLYAQGSTGTTQSTCTSIDGTTYSLNELLGSEAYQQNVDLGYHYTSDAAIISPHSLQYWAGLGDYANMTHKNVTKIYAKSSTFDFDNADAASIEVLHSEFTDADVQAYEDGLAVGSIVPFETQSGKKGILKVTALEPGYGVDDFITIDIKVVE